MLDIQLCQQARLSRDPRFDGLYFVAVTTTGIYCRNVCAVPMPREHNVQYFETAVQAAAAGFRPCLRCHPDSAPGSNRWLGTEPCFRRALRQIQQGALQHKSVGQLADSLGVGERYLRKLFQQRLGISPKQYALYQQILFAKQLLHQTPTPIAHVAEMAGFHSVRRFNDAFKLQLKLTPSQVRRHNPPPRNDSMLELKLSYRPPYAWETMLAFYQQRTLEGLEWVDQQRYGRTISWPLAAPTTHGWFEVCPIPMQDALKLTLYWPEAASLQAVVQQIRRLLDLDCDSPTIDHQFSNIAPLPWIPGLRLPGLWSPFEAAVRAILGQQVSIAGARTQLNRLLQGFPATEIAPGKRRFVLASELATSELAMIRVPQARRHTLQALGHAVTLQPDADPQTWLAIKGIGPWTVGYAQMRGQSAPNIWLGGDLGVQKALACYTLSEAHFQPWQSYATLQLWHLPKGEKS